MVVVDDQLRDRRYIDASGEQGRRGVGSGGGVGLLLVGRDDTRRALRTDRALGAFWALGTGVTLGAGLPYRALGAFRALGTGVTLGARVSLKTLFVPLDGGLAGLALARRAGDRAHCPVGVVVAAGDHFVRAGGVCSGPTAHQYQRSRDGDE